MARRPGSAQTGPLRTPRRDELLRAIKDDRGHVVYDDYEPGTYDLPNALVPWYRYTGTKQDTRPAHGWMIGFAPAEHPTIAFAVLVEYGGGGGPAAGSVVKKLVEAAKEEGYVK